MPRNHVNELRLDKSQPLGKGFRPVACRCQQCCKGIQVERNQIVATALKRLAPAASRN